MRDTTPLGLMGLRGRFPQGSGQPWAEGWNPVGIPESSLAKANPIGVAVYQLQSKLPGEFKSKLPTAKQLANIVRGEMDGGK